MISPMSRDSSLTLSQGSRWKSNQHVQRPKLKGQNDYSCFHNLSFYQSVHENDVDVLEEFKQYGRKNI
jgi:hypothetical protein